MKGLFILLWAFIAFVNAIAPSLPRETRNPPLRMHRRQDAIPPYPTSPPKANGPRCPRALASLFTDIYHDNIHFCTLYERGWTITITTDCQGCNVETMTMPRKHCANTANVTFRIPSTTIECQYKRLNRHMGFGMITWQSAIAKATFNLEAVVGSKDARDWSSNLHNRTINHVSPTATFPIWY
ncbi:hypothetical protein E6O75_ATG02166 [Venturia nashicola]|uniref:Uncharacterized protein n=1 Tax=Venturia nashicola TaxID=86259 RepID=A0A4Z1PKU3_9PEZI|nr:hypothetical protein E6O75_ATG02166 [Venturia nashicola]